MCPTSWKIAGISLLVWGVGAAIPADQGTALVNRKPAPAAPAEPARIDATDGPSAKDHSVMEHLDEKISMCFVNDTPLQAILKYIKSATQGENDTGIPIYVDPVGLVEAEKTMTSPVALDLEGVPLRITLRLVLKQMGLTYLVRDGLLTITSESFGDQPISILENLNKAKRGELTLDEVRALTELVEAVSELDQASQKLFGGGQAKK